VKLSRNQTAPGHPRHSGQEEEWGTPFLHRLQKTEHHYERLFSTAPD
jgi:hypothetical protein